MFVAAYWVVEATLVIELNWWMFGADPAIYIRHSWGQRSIFRCVVGRSNSARDVGVMDIMDNCQRGGGGGGGF